MYTQCPECMTIVEVDAALLQASRGTVCCGHCATRFDARHHLVDAPPDAAPGDHWFASLHTDLTAALIADAAGIPRGVTEDDGDWSVTAAPGARDRTTGLEFVAIAPTEPAAIDPARRAPATEAPPAPGIGQPAGVDAIRPDGAGPDPREAAPVSATPGAGGDEDTGIPIYVPPRRHWFAHAGPWWALGCLGLAVALAAQLCWAQRAELLRNPQTRPWVAAICARVPCRLPLIRATGKLEFISRDIRPDPHRAGALLITATVRNDAGFRQPWPVVSVELSDIDGTRVAMRRFRPAEYLRNPTRRAAGIGSGATVALAFEVADPGKRAVNFEFGFE